MTIVTEPSNGRGVANHQTISAVARWGGSSWIVPSGVDINADRTGLAGTPLNGATITTSGLTASIDTFEAFFDGAWVASDDSTDSEHDHTLPGNTTTTTLYLGYDLSAADTFIFGPAGDFGANDPKVVVGDFVDDGTAITTVHDRRPTGPKPDSGVLIDAVFDTDDTTTLHVDTGTLSVTYPEYRVHIYRECHDASEEYQSLRLNGVSSTSYEFDVYDGHENTFSSAQGSAFTKIAGTDLGTTGHAAWCNQILSIKLPPEFVSNGQHYPLLDTDEIGVSEGVDHIFHGVLKTDVNVVDRIDVFGGGNATGWIAIYGVSRIIGE